MSFRTLCSGAIEMQRGLAVALGLLCLCRNLFSSQSYLGDDVHLDAMGSEGQASTKLHVLFGRLFLLMMCRRFWDWYCTSLLARALPLDVHAGFCPTFHFTFFNTLACARVLLALSSLNSIVFTLLTIHPGKQLLYLTRFPK